MGEAFPLAFAVVWVWKAHRFMCLNYWSPVGRTFEEGWGAVALLEEMCHLGWALRFQKPTPFHSHQLPPPIFRLYLPNSRVSDWALRFCSITMSACCHAPHPHPIIGHGLLLCNCKQSPKLNASFYKLPESWCFVTTTKVTKKASDSVRWHSWFLCWWRLAVGYVNRLKKGSTH